MLCMQGKFEEFIIILSNRCGGPFLKTQQRLWPKMVELMEGFLWMENKTKISATHRQTGGKHI